MGNSGSCAALPHGSSFAHHFKRLRDPWVETEGVDVAQTRCFWNASLSCQEMRHYQGKRIVHWRVPLSYSCLIQDIFPLAGSLSLQGLRTSLQIKRPTRLFCLASQHLSPSRHNMEGCRLDKVLGAHVGPLHGSTFYVQHSPLV